MAMQRAQQTIESLELKAPIDGYVAVKENRDASGGMFFFGMVLPEYREGDSVWPGRPVVDIIESGRMELRAKVDESDRGNLAEGQEAEASAGGAYAEPQGQLAAGPRPAVAGGGWSGAPGGGVQISFPPMMISR